MKTLTLVIALAATSLAGYSQNNNQVAPPDPIEQSHFSLGVKGGFGHSTIMPYKNNTFCPSWDAGITAVYSPWQHWGIEADLAWSEEGINYKLRNPETNTHYTSQVYLDYIRIPIKAVYFFRSYDKDFRPKVQLGPTLGFLANQVNSSGAASFDLGANATLGFNYRIARAVWINVDATYYQGFLDTYAHNTDTDLNANWRLDAGVCVGF